MSTVLTHDVYGRVPAAGQFERPSFWTKRKKTATSLLAVMALIAGLAVAFKLFDRTVGDNVVRDAATFNFAISKKDALLGETTFEPTAAGNEVFEFPYKGTVCDAQGRCAGDMYPGDTRTVEVKLQNTNAQPARDASFRVYIENIRVVDARNPASRVLIAETDPRWARFVSFFQFSVDREKVLYADGIEINEDDHRGTTSDENGMRQYEEACEGGLREIVRGAPCDLGMIRAAGKTDALGDPTDIRYYKFNVTEIDDGTDQSAFKGWHVGFDLVFAAQLPAVPESAPVGER